MNIFSFLCNNARRRSNCDVHISLLLQINCTNKDMHDCSNWQEAQTLAVNSQAPENTIRGMCCASLIYRQYSMACRGWVDWTHFSRLFSLDARSVDTLKRQLIEGHEWIFPRKRKLPFLRLQRRWQLNTAVSGRERDAGLTISAHPNWITKLDNVVSVRTSLH